MHVTSKIMYSNVVTTTSLKTCILNYEFTGWIKILTTNHKAYHSFDLFKLQSKQQSSCRKRYSSVIYTLPPERKRITPHQRTPMSAANPVQTHYIRCFHRNETLLVREFLNHVIYHNSSEHGCMLLLCMISKDSLVDIIGRNWVIKIIFCHPILNL